MEVYDQMVKRQRKWMLYMLALFILLAAVLPAQRPLFLGLLLGSVISYYGMRLLQNRLRLFGEKVVETGKAKGLGTTFRLLGAVAAVFLAFYLEDRVNYYGVVAGLATSYVVLFIDASIYFVWKDVKK